MTEAGNAGEKFEELVGILETLRGPGGCPWDRARTARDIRDYFLEEVYEAVEALEAGRCREPGRGAGGRPDGGRLPVPDPRGAGSVHRRRRPGAGQRQDDRPPPPRLRVAAGDDRRPASPTPGRRGRGRRRAGPPSSRTPGPRPRPSFPHSRSAAGFPRADSTGRTPRGSWPRSGKRRASSKRRSRRRMRPGSRRSSATCCSRWPTCRGSSGSIRSSPSARPTPSSCAVSGRSRNEVRSSGRELGQV